MVKERLWHARSVLVLLGLLWSVGVGAGLYVMWNYDMTPGKSGTPPPLWPAGSHLARHAGLPTLVMLVHPRCSCSRASLQELADLLRRFHGRVSATVLLYTPAAQAWEKTELWDTVAALPGVQAVRDLDGREARLFQAYTSGDTVLYDAGGHLLFHGGMTPSRGHVGDNAGSHAIAAVLAHQPPERQHAAVFGCDLFAPEL